MLALVMLGLMSAGVVVQAEESKPRQPSDFFWEQVAVGTVGGFLGFSVAAWLEFGCPTAVVDFLLDTETICSGERGWLSGAVTLGWATFLIPLGAVSFIALHGVLRGINGNILYAAVSSLLGSVIGLMGGFVVGVYVWAAVVEWSDAMVVFRIAFTFTWSFVTAIAATYGYNSGATMREAGAMMPEFSLRLFDWTF